MLLVLSNRGVLDETANRGRECPQRQRPIRFSSTRTFIPTTLLNASNRCRSSLSGIRPLVYRTEQETHLEIYLQGLVGGLERKSIEPIATAHGLYRRPLQHFVGAGKWSDLLIRTEMQHHVVE